MEPHSDQPFRVLIAGGGIAGLALADALQRAGIDSLLLEAQNEVAPEVGAQMAGAFLIKSRRTTTSSNIPNQQPVWMHGRTAK